MKGIVLFIEKGRGMVVKADEESDCDMQIGDYSEKWYEDTFEYFNGTIELSN